jgi:recombination protein RecT
VSNDQAVVRQKAANMKELVEGMGAQLAANLSNDKAATARLSRIFLTEAQRNPRILDCTKASVWSFLMTCAELKLEPGSSRGHIYPVPFKQKNGDLILTPIVGYMGYIELAYRSGKVASISAYARYEKDFYQEELGSEPRIVHRRAEGERGPLKGAYCCTKLTAGGLLVLPVSKDDIALARARSKARDSGPWITDYDSMAVKTAVRRARKFWPQTEELVRLAEVDDETDAPGPTETMPEMASGEDIAQLTASLQAQMDADYAASEAQGVQKGADE